MNLRAAAILAVLGALVPCLVSAQVPDAAKRWQRDLVRQTRLEWGLEAPVATFAAQVETESNFRTDARSPVGALGLAQFMPATAKWISGANAALADNDPLNPQWALRALAAYDRHLWLRQPLAATDCDRAAFMLSGYNGGETALAREQDICLTYGCDPDRWWGQVELMRGRGAAAWHENRNYPKRIRAREPVYTSWGRGLCTS